MPEKPVPQKIQTILSHWSIAANLLLTLYIAFTMLSIVCSVIVGSSSAVAASVSDNSLTRFGFLAAWQVALLSILAAIAVGALSAFDVRGNYVRRKKVVRILRDAILNYEQGKKGYTMDKLLAEFDSCEKTLMESKVTIKS